MKNWYEKKKKRRACRPGRPSAAAAHGTHQRDRRRRATNADWATRALSGLRELRGKLLWWEQNAIETKMRELARGFPGNVVNQPAATPRPARRAVRRAAAQQHPKNDDVVDASERNQKDKNNRPMKRVIILTRAKRGFPHRHASIGVWKWLETGSYAEFLGVSRQRKNVNQNTYNAPDHEKYCRTCITTS